MAIYYIDLDRKKRNTAGAKAPDDIAAICAKKGYKRFTVPNFPSDKNKVYKKLWLAFACNGWWKKLKNTLSDGDVVIFQHPMYGKRVAAQNIKKIKAAKKVSFIAVIHDLESLRGGIAGVVNQNKKTNAYGDTTLLSTFDAVICHNKHMRKYMIGQGFEEKKLVDLEIFDYLSDIEREQPKKSDKASIAIAGNLAVGKCKYIYDITSGGHNPGLTINLYGVNYQEADATENMVYHGSFKPEELPSHLTGDFGLVWDGNTAETCGGNTGEYLRYNNPHKTSLYLSSAMPVVVWKQAAIADFILENKAGIAIDSLYELEEAISRVTDEEYEIMKSNVKKISEKLRSGYYFSTAVEECMTGIGK